MTIPLHAYWVVCPDAFGTDPALLAQAARLGGPERVVCVAWGEALPPPGGAVGVMLPDTRGDACAMGSMLAQLLEAHAPEAVLAPATVQGRTVLAWAAAKLETGLTADCTALSVTADGLLLQTRPAFGGRMIADILCREKRPQIATVRTVGLAPSEPGQAPALLLRPEIPARAYLRRVRNEPVEDGAALSDAEVIVVGGMGVGGKEGFALLGKLARLLGGAVGTTRAAVDAGYAPYRRQIGQTGRVVRPRLYIAVGVHGAVQHTLGMDGSRRVVAINRDRNAPIFSHADYGIVSDWRKPVEELIAELEREREHEV